MKLKDLKIGTRLNTVMTIFLVTVFVVLGLYVNSVIHEQIYS